MRNLFLVAVVAAGLLSVAPTGAAGRTAAGSTTHVLSASLRASAAVPSPKGQLSHATGTFTASLTLAGKRGTLAWRLAFAGLSGRVTAAQIRLGAPGKTGPVAIPLCRNCRTGANGTFKGTIGSRKALLQALLHRGAYVNVQTAKNPNGELRGQVGSWLSYAPAQHTATLAMVAGLDHSNSGLNFNGYANGNLQIAVPKGWKVTVDCANQDTSKHSCAIVSDAGATGPAFPGAATTNAKAGLAPGKQESFTFTAARTGAYRIASLAGHEKAGIWDRLRVTATDSTPSVAVQPANAIVVSTASVPGLGRVLVDHRGLTLYMFVPDKRKKVTCVSTCARIWPPLQLAPSETLLAHGGAKAALLGSDRDPAGGRVATYHGWPLYTYVGDRKPGEAFGQALNLNGGLWYVLAPSGKVIKTKLNSGGTSSGSTTTTTTAKTTPTKTTTTKTTKSGICGTDDDADNDQGGGAPDDGDGCI